MVITIGPELEAALTECATEQGLTPDELVLNAPRERFLGVTTALTASVGK